MFKYISSSEQYKYNTTSITRSPVNQLSALSKPTSYKQLLRKTIQFNSKHTVEPRLSEQCRRHTIGPDKREVWIGGVASEMSIGRVYGGR